MHPEVAQVIAERSLRKQHKFLVTWNKHDQADENLWTMHDNNQGLNGERVVHAMPYAICTVCEYLKKVIQESK